LARTLGVEPGEGHLFAWATATFFLVHAASVALANAADTFFLKRIGVQFVPLAFLASSLMLVLTTSAGPPGVPGRRSPPGERCSPALGSFRYGCWCSPTFAPCSRRWSSSRSRSNRCRAGVLVALGGLLHARQAKWLYAPIVAGGTLGEIAGSFASGSSATRSASRRCCRSPVSRSSSPVCSRCVWARSCRCGSAARHGAALRRTRRDRSGC
jgi:hypothetical protein